MSKAIDVHLSQVRFPSTCVVCTSPACKEYKIQKIFSHGRRSYTVSVNAPMCDLHFASANFKGTAEKLVGRIGVVMGILAGLFGTIMLLLHWQGIGQGNLFLNLFAGSVFGIGVFLIVWAIISLSMAPLFAEPASKEARHAVKMTRYWPRDQFVRLEFRNEQLAEVVRNIN